MNLEIFDERAVVALEVFERQPELRATLWKEVDAFFQRHPALQRTEQGAAYIACILLKMWAETGEVAA